MYPPKRYSWNTTSEQIDNVDCTGTESKLSDCHYDTNNLESYYSVGVVCQDGKCELCLDFHVCQAWLRAFLAMYVHAFSSTCRGCKISN